MIMYIYMNTLAVFYMNNCTKTSVCIKHTFERSGRLNSNTVENVLGG